MATLGGGEGEPLDGEYDPYRSDGEGGEYDASTTDGNEEPVAVAAQFPRRDLRESLGFLRATRRLALPGAGFDEESDDGSVVALAAVDVFGLLLVSSATGACIFEKGRSPPQTARHTRGVERRQRLRLPQRPVTYSSPLSQVATQPCSYWTATDVTFLVIFCHMPPTRPSLTQTEYL